MNNNNLTCFLDQVGRTIFAEKVTDPEILKGRTDDSVLVVKNPVVVHISQKPTGEMALQLLPIFFKEFLDDKNADVIFAFNTNMISMADPVEFDEKLQNNYRGMFSSIVLPSEGTTIPTGENVIDLFDEKK
ncbi:MAG: hypothetical protein ABIO05_05040 [Ferruginibacter sp.]